MLDVMDTTYRDGALSRFSTRRIFPRAAERNSFHKNSLIGFLR